eukprot:SAG31_NODE_3915_length_3755_cov_1.358862_5_plen_139_part_00
MCISPPRERLEVSDGGIDFGSCRQGYQTLLDQGSEFFAYQYSSDKLGTFEIQLQISEGSSALGQVQADPSCRFDSIPDVGKLVNLADRLRDAPDLVTTHAVFTSSYASSFIGSDATSWLIAAGIAGVICSSSQRFSLS